MESMDIHELLIQAREFSSDFDAVVRALLGRLLPLANQRVPNSL
jgi:hypothetical protein